MNFDLLASHYDWLEALTAGGRLQMARTACLDELAGRSRILSVGEGHGRFAAACAARFPEADITSVEASPRMIAQARKRMQNAAPNIHWICRDVLAWAPEGKYDAIVTCFFLDCFAPDELAEIITKLTACATADAVWLVVDFAIPSRGLARWRALAVHWLMYVFFRRVVALPARRLTPPDALLRAHGFQPVRHREFEWGLLRAELWRRA